MSVVTITDAGGATLKALEVNGRRYPPLPVEKIKALRTFKLRADDIILVTFPKSGSHWLLEVVNMVQTGKTEFAFSDGGPGDKWSPFMEMNSPGATDSLPSPRVLFTHILFEDMPTDLLEKKPKIVFVYRNPKDVLVSFYNHHKKVPFYGYTGSWNDYFELAVQGELDYGKWTDHTLSWEKVLAAHPELTSHVLTYEDMKEHPLRELRRLATFLEKDCEENFLQQVRDKTSFSTMQKEKGAKGFKTPDGKSIMYRKGEIGDWKNYFTVAQSERVDAMLKDKMADSKFTWRETPETT